MGWRVIIYDRFALHKEFLLDLIGMPGVDYHPYTMFELTNPTKYNEEFKKQQGTDRMYFYSMEKRWGFKGNAQADTADQDQDKTKTYDHCRVEYSHLDMVLYIDTDEIFYCPQSVANIDSQRRYQQKIMRHFTSQGVEEMRFVRLPYSGMAIKDFNGTKEQLKEADFTENTEKCMSSAYETKNIATMFKCWSSASAYDNFPKSADFGGVCPFHYNHWSCDGMRNGGRDAGNNIPRCRCKVAFDMINGFEYKPILDRCHLMHFNDNKFLFQSRREKHANDHGNIQEYNAVAKLFE